MITYEYICSACDYVHEVLQSPKKFRKLKTCPKCKQKTLVQQYFAPHVNFNPEQTTLIQVAHSNTKKMGKLELEDRRRKDKKEVMQMKFNQHVQKGMIDQDHANHIIEKTLDKPKESNLDLPKDIKKKLSTGTKEEKQKKIDKYITKGTA